MLELILQLLIEFFIQIVGQLFFEMGLHKLFGLSSKKQKPNFVMAILAYIIFGCVLGWVSICLFPAHFITDPFWQKANLILTPIAAGLTMSLIGAWRRKKGQNTVRLDQFGYGFLFALACSLVRHYGAI